MRIFIGKKCRRSSSSRTMKSLMRPQLFNSSLHIYKSPICRVKQPVRHHTRPLQAHGHQRRCLHLGRPGLAHWLLCRPPTCRRCLLQELEIPQHQLVRFQTKWDIPNIFKSSRKKNQLANRRRQLHMNAISNSPAKSSKTSTCKCKRSSTNPNQKIALTAGVLQGPFLPTPTKESLGLSPPWQLGFSSKQSINQNTRTDLSVKHILQDQEVWMNSRFIISNNNSIN